MISGFDCIISYGFCSVCGHEGRKMMRILELEMEGTGEGGREIENQQYNSLALLLSQLNTVDYIIIVYYFDITSVIIL